MTLLFNHGGQSAAVVLGAHSPSGSGMTRAKAEGWRDAFWNQARFLCLNTVTLTGAIIRDVSGPDGQVIEVGPPATNATGSGTTGIALAAGSTLIKWSTEVGGRTGKGRTYVPGLSTSSVNTDGRTYTAGHISGVTSAVNGYLGAAVFDLSFQPAVLSFTRGAPRRIIGGAAAPVVGIQRRRMR